MDDECEDPMVQECQCLEDTVNDSQHGDEDGDEDDDERVEDVNLQRHSRILRHLGQSIG